MYTPQITVKMKNTFNILLLYLFVSFFMACSNDNFLEEVVVVEEITEDIIDEKEIDAADPPISTPIPTVTLKEGQIYPENGVMASTFGYTKENATVALKAALESNNSVIIIDKQEADWIIEPLKLFGINNKRIFLEEGVVIRSKASAFGELSASLIDLIMCEDLIIDGYEASFQMNKEEYTDGEWRHALSIRGSSGITIRGLEFRDSGGDGIYLSGTENPGTFSENIIIEDIKSINNKRQGFSIISAKDVWVTNSLFSETNGALPESGVDFEPNRESDILENINFSNCSFTNNKHAGILLSLGNLTSNSSPISINFTDCFTSSNSSIENAYVDSEIVIGGNSNSLVQGDVQFDRLTIDGSDWGMLYSRKVAEGFHVSFTDCVLKNICKDNSKSPITLEVADYSSETESLGGFTFNNIQVEYATDVPLITINGWETLKTLKDIKGNFKMPQNGNQIIKYSNYDKVKNTNVSILLEEL